MKLIHWGSPPPIMTVHYIKTYINILFGEGDTDIEYSQTTQELLKSFGILQ